MTTIDPSKLERMLRATHVGSYSEAFDAAFDAAEGREEDSAATEIGFMQCSRDGRIYVSTEEPALVVIDEHLFEPPPGTKWEPRLVAGGVLEEIEVEPEKHDLGAKVRCMNVDYTGIVHLVVGRSEVVRVRNDQILSRQSAGAKIYAVCGVDADTTYAVVGGSQIELMHRGDRSAVVNVGEHIEDIFMVGDMLYVMLESGELQMYHGSPTPQNVLNLRSKDGTGPFNEDDYWFTLFLGPEGRICVQGEDALAIVKDGRCIEHYTFADFEGGIDDVVALEEGSFVVLADNNLWHCSGGKKTRGQDDLYALLEECSPRSLTRSSIAPSRIYVATGWAVHALDLHRDNVVPEEQMHLLDGKKSE